MSVATRIQAIEEHIGTIYDSLEVAGSDLTNVDKNIVNIDTELRKDLLYYLNNGVDVIWTNWEKVLGSGESITLSNTTQAPMKLDLKGNTSQITYTGKNKLNLPNGTYTDYSVTNTSTDGKVVSSGTFSSAGSVLIATLSPTYTIQANDYLYLFNDKTPTGTAQIFGKDNNGTMLFAQTINATNFKIDLNQYAGSSLKDIYFYGTNGAKMDITCYPMIAQGSSVTDYEPYVGGIPSPNPSYPQPIHSVSGDNTIEVCGKNLFNKDNANELNAYVNGSGVLTSSANDKSIWVPIRQNTNYAMSMTQIAKSTSQYVDDVQVGLFASEPTIGDTGNRVYVQARSSATQDFSFSTTFNSGNYNYMVVKIANTTRTEYADSLDTLQIEQNNHVTTYEAYQSQTLPINLPVENLLNESSLTTKTDHGLTWKYEDNKIKISGEATSNYSQSGKISATIPKGTYYFSSLGTTNLSYNCWLYNSSNTLIANSKTNNPLTINENASYIEVFVEGVTSSSNYNETMNFQLELGEKANHYTPYGTTPIELNKIGTYQDYFYKDNGKWYKYNAIGKATWLTDSKYPASYQNISAFTCNKPTNANDYGKAIVSTYIFESAEYSSNNSNWDNADLIGKICNRAELNRIWTIMAVGVTLEQAKALIDGKIYYYILSSPYLSLIEDTTLINQLDTLANAYSYDTQTNISQVNNDKPFIIDTTALEKYGD